jgi:8-oxo-dGTP pyrophosphatase MutT (NUDIX family)
MAQKYKVFIEEKVIYFSDVEIEGIKILELSVASDYKSLLNEINVENQLITLNPKETMMIFFQNFKFIQAAGGIVENLNQYLFIKRNGLWDIPKGKIEKNEPPESAAIREIQEECGLKGELTIRKKLMDTFHTYEFQNKSVLKKTHWFLLDYSGNKDSKPQLEEGITEATWLEKSELCKITVNTFSSINDVLLKFLDFNQ